MAWESYAELVVTTLVVLKHMYVRARERESSGVGEHHLDRFITVHGHYLAWISSNGRLERLDLFIRVFRRSHHPSLGQQIGMA